MFRHILNRSVLLPLPRPEVFEFFSEAGNLERITPPELRFQILTPLPILMKAGTRIDYRLRLYGIPLLWKTQITRWEPPVEFIDEQIEGPYAEWVHYHHFAEISPKETRMVDRVTYRLPWSPLGELAFPLVRAQLARIFNYRRQKVRQAIQRQWR
jgi:ligand-binding SRPBCC domain-containing protein